jgi:hypothetical protein
MYDRPLTTPFPNIYILASSSRNDLEATLMNTPPAYAVYNIILLND